jgi:hypothetical protein
MINLSLNKQLSIILPNTNKALAEVLKDATPKQLEALTQGKDLNSILDTLLKQSAKEPQQNATLLNLLKNNPTLKDLGNVTTTIKDLSTLLKQDKEPLQLEKVLKNFTGDLQNISEKDVKAKIENSGVFLESKIKNTALAGQKEMLANDLKAVLLKTHEELSNSAHPNKQELLKQIDKLTLQIDYYQLSSHLANASSLYIPYSWDALEDGSITLKSAKEDKFFCDIDLQLKEHGQLKLRLGMFEKNQLNMNITTESQKLKTLIQENIQELRKQLVDSGIMPRDIRFIEESHARSPYDENSQSLAMGFEVKV